VDAQTVNSPVDHEGSQDHRDKSRKEKSVFITVIITIIIMIITVNFTEKINKEPRAILCGIINAVKTVWKLVINTAIVLLP